MKDFNLLPVEYRKEQFTRKKLIIIVLLIFALVFIVRYGCLIPLQKEKDVQNQLTALKQDTIKFPELEEQYTHQEEELEGLQQRLLSFREIEEHTPLYWRNVINSLLESLPVSSLLNQFTCDSTTLILSGTCPNDKASADYLRNLTESGYFSEIRMDKIVYQQNNEVNYTIRCTLKCVTEEESP